MKQSHPSRLALDEYLAQTLHDPDGSIGRHIESCQRCRMQIEKTKTEEKDFLTRFPSPSSLPHKIHKQPRRSIVLVPLSALAATAAIILTVLILRSEPPSLDVEDDLEVLAFAEEDILASAGTVSKESLLVFGVDRHRNVYWHSPDWVESARTIYPFPVISVTGEE
jgi:hypothetical protein